MEKKCWNAARSAAPRVEWRHEILSWAQSAKKSAVGVGGGKRATSALSKRTAANRWLHDRAAGGLPVEFDPATREQRANYHFLTSAVAPRPIAWITTIDPATKVVNAAPFSWYNSVCADPPMIMAAIIQRADGRPKDTVRNIRATKEFVVNLATKKLATQMVQTSGDYAPDVSEVEVVKLRTVPSRKVAPPRLADSPVHLECRLAQEIPLGRVQKVSLILGEVVHMAADDDVLNERGDVDPAKVTLVARMGGSEYVDTERFFTMKRPAQEDVLRK